MRNRLKDEKSPYLLQHADNPVEWYPWSETAFEMAKKRDVPVFLSIGYATCHWCHVMAHESFEDDQVAELMNRAFINIKVDREERPDIDSTYMRVCQMISGQGGWPLTIIMTPDKEPFFAATYIPKKTRANRMGMLELIPGILEVWNNERKRVMNSAGKVSRGFAQSLRTAGGESPGEETLEKAYLNLRERYDSTEGGFGRAPKFPMPHTLSFLLQYGSSTNHPDAVEMATHTLTKMRLGGIFDHVGYGFHRYATDRQWFLPHFEKMLYDQALLIRAFTDAWTVTKTPLFKQTVYEISDYVLTKLKGPDGGFYSAEDADSDGEEGKFYVWTLEEIRAALPPADAALAADLFAIEPDGNFTDEATGQRTGGNILSLTKPLPQLAEERNMDTADLSQRLESIRKKLYSVREKRNRPLLDDKILTDWNGLMIASLAHAAVQFHDSTLLQAVESASVFITQTLTENNRLLHRYRDGEAAIRGMADDYAFFIDAQITLYHATQTVSYLESAISLCKTFMEHFQDEENGGFFLTNRSAEPLLGRQKEIYDGAIPSSNSIMAGNLLRLGRLTGDSHFEEAADRLFRSFSRFLSSNPDSSTKLLQALLYRATPAFEIVICGKSDHPEVARMIRHVHESMRSPFVLILKTGQNASALASLSPYTAAYPVEEIPAAYICRNFSCDKPVNADELQHRLSQLQR